MAEVENPIRGLGMRFQGKVIEVPENFCTHRGCDARRSDCEGHAMAGRRRLNLEGGVKTRRGTSFEGAPRLR